MLARCVRWLSLVILLAAISLPQGLAAAARPRQTTSSELIAAVNNLRLSRGLAPLGAEPILMQVAQSQADALLATEGQVGHSRPNGITLTQQLLLLGYPLWGDLSLGGYRSENFIFGYQLTAANAAEAWLGDDPHTNTMLSENRNDIGAGVAIGSDGMVYLVIDTALSTPNRLPQSDADIYLPGGPGSTPDAGLAVSQYIVPIAVSTARPDGNVYHTVQYGQTLWGIAIDYDTKIEMIRSLNHLGGTTVYPNQLLLVKQGATQPPPDPTALPAVASGGLDLPPVEEGGVRLAPAFMPTPDAVQEPAPASEPRGPSITVWIALVVLLLLAGGLSAAWFIREPGQ